MGAAQRIFVGWNVPFLRPAVQRWLELVRERALDPAACLIVLPGRRAARRVEELIAELAPPALAPPRVITDGQLAQAVSRERLALASGFERALAWREALRGLPEGSRSALWSTQRGEIALAALAKVCAGTLQEVWAEAVEARGIAERAARDANLGDPERWRALAELEARLRAIHAGRDRLDPAQATLEVARRRLARADLHVSLFALADPPRAQRELLAQLGERVSSFVFAPPELAGDFDELGCLRLQAWEDRDVPVDAARWRVVDTPDDQALAVLERLEIVAGDLRPEDVSIGVLDADVLPFLERRLSEAGCEPRWAGGRPLARSTPVSLLVALREWLAQPSFDSYAALMRHPDLERAIASAAGVALGAIPSALDEYAERHLPAAADGTWLTDRRSGELARFHAELLALLGELADGRSRPLALWADAIARTWTRVWPRLAADERDATGAALREFAELLVEARDAASDVALTAVDALELLSERCESAELAPPPPSGARPTIELFGWLELALDDAPELCITGVNEGSLPHGAGKPAWLTEGLRRELGLAHEARRVARDTWALSAIVASRPSTLLVSGRRSSRRDPLVPSRLVFRRPAGEIVERVRRAWPREDEPRTAPAAHARPFVPPRVARPPLTEISVTGFKAYLQSPYLFYLKHVLRLDTRDDRAVELDGAAFGSLAHGALQALGEQRELCNSTDEAALAAELNRELDRRAALLFGADARVAVRLQIEKLRLRLERFARWQAQQVADGWRVREVEFAPPDVRIGPPGRELRLRGRIDRIDFHESTRRWRVLDYKTGGSDASPRAAHVRGERWIDLQLPLYRYLARDLVGPDASIEDGYVLLDKSDAPELFALAKWREGDLASALEVAREVVERVLRGEFDEVGEDVPREPVFAALCGFGLLGGDEDSGGEGDA